MKIFPKICVIIENNYYIQIVEFFKKFSAELDHPM